MLLCGALSSMAVSVGQIAVFAQKQPLGFLGFAGGGHQSPALRWPPLQPPGSPEEPAAQRPSMHKSSLQFSYRHAFI